MKAADDGVLALAVEAFGDARECVYETGAVRETPALRAAIFAAVDAWGERLVFHRLGMISDAMTAQAHALQRLTDLVTDEVGRSLTLAGARIAAGAPPYPSPTDVVPEVESYSADDHRQMLIAMGIAPSLLSKPRAAMTDAERAALWREWTDEERAACLAAADQFTAGGRWPGPADTGPGRSRTDAEMNALWGAYVLRARAAHEAAQPNCPGCAGEAARLKVSP